RLGGGYALARLRQLCLQLGHPLGQVRVLLDQPGQLELDQVEELIDLVLAVATLPDRRLVERDVMNVGWSKRHGGIPYRSRRRPDYADHSDHFGPYCHIDTCSRSPTRRLRPD